MLENPPETQEVYNYLNIDKVTAAGFNWETLDRDVPYGPNEVITSGSAVFTDGLHAEDKQVVVPLDPNSPKQKWTFTLKEGGTKRQKTVTVKIPGNENEPVYHFIPSTYETGFDCDKASTPIEQGLCHDKRLAQADKEMGGLYKAAKAKLSKREAAGLVADQKNWLKQRNTCQKGKEADGICLSLSYANRMAALQKVMDPSLGKAPMFDGDYLAGIYKKGMKPEQNTPFLLVLATKYKDTTIKLMGVETSYQANITAEKTVITGKYSYEYVCYPADCDMNVTFKVSADKNGQIQLNQEQESKGGTE
ncbi:MAG: lysozyme inhibitor LprI family protein [Deltaproteobacteria bacterium]|nr:lysozyme inhibitor LprI family protein [Deltaproteobacteria bacterium]